MTMTDCTDYDTLLLPRNLPARLMMDLGIDFGTQMMRLCFAIAIDGRHEEDDGRKCTMIGKTTHREEYC